MAREADARRAEVEAFLERAGDWAARRLALPAGLLAAFIAAC